MFSCFLRSESMWRRPRPNQPPLWAMRLRDLYTPESASSSRVFFRAQGECHLCSSLDDVIAYLGVFLWPVLLISASRLQGKARISSYFFCLLWSTESLIRAYPRSSSHSSSATFAPWPKVHRMLPHRFIANTFCLHVIMRWKVRKLHRVYQGSSDMARTKKSKRFFSHKRDSLFGSLALEDLLGVFSVRSFGWWRSRRVPHVAHWMDLSPNVPWTSSPSLQDYFKTV